MNSDPREGTRVVPRRHTSSQGSSAPGPPEIQLQLVNGRPLSPSQQSAIQAMYHAQRQPLVYPAVYAASVSRSTSARSSFEASRDRNEPTPVNQRMPDGLSPIPSLSNWEAQGLAHAFGSISYQPAAAAGAADADAAVRLDGAREAPGVHAPTPEELPTWPGYLRSLQVGRSTSWHNVLMPHRQAPPSSKLVGMPIGEICIQVWLRVHD